MELGVSTKILFRINSQLSRVFLAALKKLLKEPALPQPTGILHASSARLSKAVELEYQLRHEPQYDRQLVIKVNERLHKFDASWNMSKQDVVVVTAKCLRRALQCDGQKLYMQQLVSM
jgi:hypothetical protein